MWAYSTDITWRQQQLDVDGAGILVPCHTLGNHTHVYPKSTDPGWQNAGGHGKHLNRLKATKEHANANRGMMAQSWHAGKGFLLDEER